MRKYEVISIILSVVVVGLLIYFNNRSNDTHREMVDVLSEIKNK